MIRAGRWAVWIVERAARARCGRPRRLDAIDRAAQRWLCGLDVFAGGAACAGGAAGAGAAAGGADAGGGDAAGGGARTPAPLDGGGAGAGRQTPPPPGAGGWLAAPPGPGGLT